MNKITCPNCNVVNWSTSRSCIRCKVPISGVDNFSLPHRAADSSQKLPIRNASKGNSSAIIIAAGCVGALLICFLIYQSTKSGKVSKPPDKAPDQSLASQYPQINNPDLEAEKLGVKSFNLIGVDQAALDQASKGGMPNLRGPGGSGSGDNASLRGCRNEAVKVVSKNVRYYKMADEVVAQVDAKVDTYICYEQINRELIISLDYVAKNTASGNTQWVPADSNYMAELLRKNDAARAAKK
jgi:hypothetical protein